MPSAMQIPFSSWNTGLPDSWLFFSGLLTRIILDASNSDTRKVRSSRQSVRLRNLWVMSPLVRTEYGQESSDSRPLISSWKPSASLGQLVAWTFSSSLQ